MDNKWTAEMSHERFQAIQTRITEQFDQAVDPVWVAAFIDQVVDNELELYSQTPCDTCEHNYSNSCIEANCPHI